MSSLQETLIRDKRSFFMRSTSFEKLKCTAKYPFRLVGIKLSKASVVQLAESLIAKSRLVSQRLLLVLFIILYKTIGATLSIMVRTSANPLSVVAACDKHDKNTQGFYERLQEKVEKLQNHKRRLESMKISDGIIIESSNRILTNIQKITTTVISQKLNNKTVSSISGDTNTEINNKDYEFRAELKRLREYSTEKEIVLSSSSAGNYQITDYNSNKSLFELIYLYPMVYGSILIMIFQLYILGNVINTTPITFGYVFLIGSLGIIAFITFKVFFIEKFRKVKITSKNRTCELKMTDEQTIVATNLSVDEETTTTDSTLKRQSRSKLRRNIDLSNKTLSKIKLL